MQVWKALMGSIKSEIDDSKKGFALRRAVARHTKHSRSPEARAAYDRRLSEITDLLRQNVPGVSNPSGAAFELRALEDLCAARLWLPEKGLTKSLRDTLHHEGFYFDWRYAVANGCDLVDTYFPDGWRLVPNQPIGTSASATSDCRLVDPDGNVRAHVHYRVRAYGAPVVSASIMSA